MDEQKRSIWWIHRQLFMNMDDCLNYDKSSYEIIQQLIIGYASSMMAECITHKTLSEKQSKNNLECFMKAFTSMSNNSKTRAILMKYFSLKEEIHKNDIQRDDMDEDTNEDDDEEDENS